MQTKKDTSESTVVDLDLNLNSNADRNVDTAGNTTTATAAGTTPTTGKIEAENENKNSSEPSVQQQQQPVNAQESKIASTSSSSPQQPIMAEKSGSSLQSHKNERQNDSYRSERSSSYAVDRKKLAWLGSMYRNPDQAKQKLLEVKQKLNLPGEVTGVEVRGTLTIISCSDEETAGKLLEYLKNTLRWSVKYYEARPYSSSRPYRNREWSQAPRRESYTNPSANMAKTPSKDNKTSDNKAVRTPFDMITDEEWDNLIENAAQGIKRSQRDSDYDSEDFQDRRYRR